MAEEKISDKIENWLRKEEFQYNKVHDPNAGTNITLWPTHELKMHVIVMRQTNNSNGIFTLCRKSTTKDIHKTITIREA
jgi:hypothetical protein